MYSICEYVKESMKAEEECERKPREVRCLSLTTWMWFYPIFVNPYHRSLPYHDCFLWGMSIPLQCKMPHDTSCHWPVINSIIFMKQHQKIEYHRPRNYIGYYIPFSAQPSRPARLLPPGDYDDCNSLWKSYQWRSRDFNVHIPQPWCVVRTIELHVLDSRKPAILNWRGHNTASSLLNSRSDFNAKPTITGPGLVQQVQHHRHFHHHHHHHDQQ